MKCRRIDIVPVLGKPIKLKSSRPEMLARSAMFPVAPIRDESSGHLGRSILVPDHAEVNFALIRGPDDLYVTSNFLFRFQFLETH